MAEVAAETVPEETGEEGAGGGKRRKLLLIAGIVLLLAAGGGAAAYFLLGDKSGEGDEAQAKPTVRKPPVFVDLDMFTVNLAGDDADRFMQIRLVAEVRDGASGEMLKAMMPAVRNEILLLLGSKKADDLITREDKEKLAGELVQVVNRPLEGTPAAKGVEHVNFTHLIVQ